MTYILEMFQHRVARNSAAVPHKGAVKEKIGRFAGRHSFFVAYDCFYGSFSSDACGTFYLPGGYHAAYGAAAGVGIKKF